MSDDVQTFEISWEEAQRLRPILKEDKKPTEIEGAPPGPWKLVRMTTTLTPQDGIKVKLEARRA